jgi:DNA primase
MEDRQIPDEIKSKLPIEELVASYLPLKKAGRIYKGLCPFHGEKTPSFTVNPERGIYKCFGCGEGGDIFSFVMKLEGVTFPEAIRMLGDRVGVIVPEYKGSKPETSPSKRQLFELNETAAKLWHSILVNHQAGKQAREYLTKRGLRPETIKAFQIGYAPLGSVSREALSKRGFSKEDMQAAGEPAKFQDRITFPIADITGKIVGFTGRLLEHPDDTRSPESRGPKYWNTPETPLFVKSRALYALHLAKHAMQEKGLTILAEGQMDVAMLHQAGYQHTVASSGTALTPEQLAIIRRFVDTIAFAYDGDKAGKAATMRGLSLALEAELVPYVISIPNGKDPADCIQHDTSLWEKAYEGRKFYMDWIISELVPEGVGSMQAEERRKVGRELVTWLAKIPDPTEQAEWFKKVAVHLQTNEQNVRELYSRLYPNSPRQKQVPQAKQKVENASLIETAAAIILTFPEVSVHLTGQWEHLSQHSGDSLVLQTLASLQKSERELAVALTTLNQAEKTELNLELERVLQPYESVELSETWALTELTIILRRIREESREREKSRIATSIAEAQTLGDTKKIQELFQELQKLV